MNKCFSLICGNKMPTRCNRCFLLQILLLAQHVSGTTMSIIRSSRVLYRWLLPVILVGRPAGRRARRPRVLEWHKCARLVECKRGSSDIIASCLRLALWFSSCRYGVELRVMCLVWGLLQQPATRTHIPQLNTIPTT